LADCAAMRPRSTGGTSSIDLVADLRVGQVALGLLHGQLGVVVLQQLILDHGADAGKGGAAGLAVDLDADVHLGAVARLGGAGEAVLHRLDHQIRVDHLLARHRLGGLQQFQLVGRSDCHGSCSRLSVSSRGRRRRRRPRRFLRSRRSRRLRAAHLLLAQHLGDQLVGQDQLGIRQPVERRPMVTSSPASSISISTSSPSTPASPPLKRRRPSISSVGLDPGLPALPDLEILQPGQRAVDAGADTSSM
jgi:hypothetical protein